MISWKGFWSVLTAVITGTGACLSVLDVLPPWLVVAAQAGCGLVLLGGVVGCVHEAPMFEAVSDTGRNQIIQLVGVGALAHLVWQVAVALRPDLWHIWGCVLALLGVIQYWSARGHQYLLTQMRRRPPPPPTVKGASNQVVASKTEILTRGLQLAGYSWLTVMRWEHIGEPRRFGVRVWVRRPSRMTISTTGENARNTNAGLLTQADAEPIAIGLAEALDREVMSDWVSINKEPAAGTYTITVVTEEVMGRIYRYQDHPAWSSVTEPKVVGYRMDGEPHKLLLAQHGQVSGQSRCIAGDTRIYLPLTDEHVRIDNLAARGEAVTVLAWTPEGMVAASTDGPPFLKGFAELFEVRCAGKAMVRATSDHQMFTPWGWRRLGELRVGGQLLSIPHATPDSIFPDAGEMEWVTITAIEPVGRGLFYDMTVPGAASYTAEGLVHHNSGKSSLIHVEFAEVSRCADAVIWVAGVEKLYDLVGGWVEPYTDTDLPLPFDWIASGQADLLTMLATAMTIARWRQRQPMGQRQGFVRIMLYLDEAYFALKNNKAKIEYQGVPYNAGQLVSMLTQGVGSAGVHVRFSSQRGVNSHYGDTGGDTTANAGFVAAFRSRDFNDSGRLTGVYRLPNPRHSGEYWLESGDGPIRLKAPYLQEVDPSKPKLHEGLTISDVAEARRNFPRALDAGSAAAAGPAYARRHVRMDESMLRYLTVDAGPDDGWPADAELDASADAHLDAAGRVHGRPDASGSTSLDASRGARMAHEELDRLGLVPHDHFGVAGPPAAGSEPGGAEVLTMMGRSTLSVRITAIVDRSHVAMSKAEILTALAASGPPPSDQVVTNALTKLVAEGRIQRPERGLYAQA